jgi:group I intron endonuclease
MKALIYSLSDPNTHELRYVGKTRRTLECRLREHVNLARKGSKQRHIVSWMRSLRSSPLINLLCEVEDENADEREIAYIALFRIRGYRLVNASDGGGGPRGYRPSVETRNKISAALRGNQHTLGLKHSTESRAKMSKSGKGRRFSVTHRKKIADALKKYRSRVPIVFSLETRAKLSRIGCGRKLSADHCAAISEGKKRGYLKRKNQESDDYI